MKGARRLMLMLVLLFSLVLASQTLFAEATKNFEIENKFIVGEEVVILFADYESLSVNALNSKPINLLKTTIYFYQEEKDLIFYAVKSETFNDNKFRKNNYTNMGRTTIRAPNITARRKTC